MKRDGVSNERTWILDLEPLPGSIGVARRSVRDWLTSVGAEALAETATLLVSELATNAVIHVGQSYTVAAFWRPPVFHVDVVDASPTAPIAVNADRPGPGGRGLKIVDQLADAWGVTASDDRKTVWFDIAASPSPTAARTLLS